MGFSPQDSFARLDDAAVHHSSGAVLEPGNLPAKFPANSAELGTAALYNNKR
jgi:hypothetical protein